MSTRNREEIIRRCDRFAMGHGRVSPHETFAALAAYTAPDLTADRYGEGELIESFEREVASLLGKEAALFMPSGTMAQQIALRIWCDRVNQRRVAFHPTSHLEIHELHAYRELHGIDAALVGPADRLMTANDIESLPGPLAALLLELPQREIGGQLPLWDDLVAQCAVARGRGARLHMDGARLWECGPFYGRDYAEIAGLFDSVYVSFYKGLGGIAGAALAGPSDFVDESRIWLRRHGGNLISLYPYVLSARKGLEERLHRMQSYHEAATVIAGRLRALEGIRVIPDEPSTNMMHVVVDAPQNRFEEAALDVASETRVFLARALRDDAPEGCSKLEITVGDATLELGPETVASLFAEVVARSRG